MIVKFVDEVDLPDRIRGVAGSSRLTVPGQAEWERRFEGLVIRRLYARSADEWQQLLARAVASDPSYRPPNFRNFVAVSAPAAIDPAEVAAFLRERADDDRIERVTLEPAPLPPPSPAVLNPRVSNQKYLLSAEEGGVDAVYAWTVLGGDGGGQELVDFEWGWNLRHEDLSEHGIAMLTGEDYSYAGHGTAVLGIIAARDNAVGCKGIAHGVGRIRCASPHSRDAAGAWGYDRHEALLACVDDMQRGHVLLIEDHIPWSGYPNGVPVEADSTLFELVRLATALGIVVIEPAGNGGANLDELRDGDGRLLLHPDSSDFRDSGAILVGATSSVPRHPVDPDSGRGLRVDCFAWGDSVYAPTSEEDRAARNLYDDTTLQNTSSASAIIAGVALVVQGIATTFRRGCFNGWELRDILANPDLGTHSESGDDVIGVMPDLRRIIESEVIGLAPDVFVRDFVGDDGSVNEGSHCTSPDVFVLQAAVVDPTASFGEGSGREDEVLPASVVHGRDNLVHVRVRNRGLADAEDVEASVFWAAPSSLLDPTTWKPLGTTRIPKVPAGGALTVSDAILWPAASVPDSGHYCFVVLVGHDADPAPEPAQFLEWDRFTRYVAINNNVGWRNFNIVETDTTSGGAWAAELALPFEIVGAWDRPRAMAIEIGGRLPRSVRMRLELPVEAYDLLRLPRSRGIVDPKDAGRLQFPFEAGLGVPEVPLARGARIRATLHVQVPARWAVFTHDVHVRQLYRGEEVGRITWRLTPPRKPRRD